MTKTDVVEKIKDGCASIPNGPFFLRDVPGFVDFPSGWGVYMYDAVKKKQIPDISYSGKEYGVNAYIKDTVGQGSKAYLSREEWDVLEDMYGSGDYMAEANDWISE